MNRLFEYVLRLGDDALVAAQRLGLTLPDPDLAYDEAAGQWRTGPIDWAEFRRVLAGDGPCNAQRMAHRRAAHDEGAWVREAASAYAAKHNTPGDITPVEVA